MILGGLFITNTSNIFNCGILITPAEYNYTSSVIVRQPMFSGMFITKSDKTGYNLFGNITILNSTTDLIKYKDKLSRNQYMFLYNYLSNAEMQTCIYKKTIICLPVLQTSDKVMCMCWDVSQQDNNWTFDSIIKTELTHIYDVPIYNTFTNIEKHNLMNLLLHYDFEIEV